MNARAKKNGERLMMPEDRQSDMRSCLSLASSQTPEKLRDFRRRRFIEAGKAFIGGFASREQSELKAELDQHSQTVDALLEKENLCNLQKEASQVVGQAKGRRGNTLPPFATLSDLSHGSKTLGMSNFHAPHGAFPTKTEENFDQKSINSGFSIAASQKSWNRGGVAMLFADSKADTLAGLKSRHFKKEEARAALREVGVVLKGDRFEALWLLAAPEGEESVSKQALVEAFRKFQR